jgi:hypothetical protein
LNRKQRKDYEAQILKQVNGEWINDNLE